MAFEYKEGEGLNFTELDREVGWRRLLSEAVELWERRDGVLGGKFTDASEQRLKEIRDKMGKEAYYICEDHWLSAFTNPVPKERDERKKYNEIAMRIGGRIKLMSKEDVEREIKEFNQRQKKDELPLIEELSSEE